MSARQGRSLAKENKLWRTKARSTLAIDQNASFACRLFEDSFCQNLPLGRSETVWQQRAPNSFI
jgi:hypothetical protein